ncbi:hypothetical protein WICPIJ_005178 [Wickerhamomyces pijperi]|uniref:Secretory component protein SHR3 n=1 Tax=Wickerhamomyces pijperi TaxID=599730 RepID=A0A9P8Q675_WICPI|nr:hypothetical protein WICPIJ_005178 [Wickerhamomyces pijperi]
MAVKYKDLLPVANGLIIAGSFFFLGLIFGNLPYDYVSLYSSTATMADIENSVRHYTTWANIPAPALHILHSLIGLGFIGLFIKIYKPSEDAKYFEYGSLFLYVVAFCIYLTNLKTGAESARAAEWGEVDVQTGINVIAASGHMIVFILGGVILLQAGLYYGEWEYQQRLEVFNRELAEEEAAAASTDAPVEKIKESTPAKGKKATSTATPAKGKSSSKKN